MIEYSSMSKQEVQKSGALPQLEGVPALVGEQGADIDGKVLLIRQGGQQGEAQPVIVRLPVDISREPIVCSQVF